MSLLNREAVYCLAICESHNLARAADALGISQPALTGILMRAEAFVSPLAARAIELFKSGFADHAHSNEPPPTRVRLTAVR